MRNFTSTKKPLIIFMKSHKDEFEVGNGVFWKLQQYECLKFVCT